jgi:hypothetical protein
MLIPMPSPLGTNKAGLFISAPPFHAAAYDSRRGLGSSRIGRDEELSTNPNSGVPLAVRPRAEDDDQEDAVHEVMRRARVANLNDCGQLRTILGNLLMAEKAQADDDEEHEKNAAEVASRFDDAQNVVDPSTDPLLLSQNKLQRAQDAACSIADFAKAHPEVARIRNIGGYDAPALPQSMCVRHAAPPPRIAFDVASDRAFAESHPEVARIKVIG